MVRLDASAAQVLVSSFKEGLLSAVAHDLRLRVERFSLDVEPGTSVKGTFDARSLVVETAMKDGVPAPAALPAFAHAEIVKNLQQDVLQVGRYPEIRFESTALDARQVRGRLTLCGVTREVVGTRRQEAGRAVASFDFDQRDFGIKPFSAMLGTLKVKPRVRVEVSLPLDAAELKAAVA